MSWLVRSVVIATGLGLSALAAGTFLREDAAAAPTRATAIGRGYDLADLKLTEHALFYVEETYVDPSRVHFEEMFVAALESVERRVPSVMFRRPKGGTLLHVEVGNHRTAWEVPPIQSRKEMMGQLRQVAALLKAHLKPTDIPGVEDGNDPFAEVEYALIQGALSTLDPHSIFLPPKQSEEMDLENEGQFGGLGVTIVLRQGRLTIEYPMKDSPAERAGLLPDDHISRIDGESTINMTLDDAVSRLRGPVGKAVQLEVKRAGLGEPLKVPVTRKVIELQRVESVLLDGGIGYVTVQGFHAKVGSQLQEELATLSINAPLKGLILDLRGNPGGYLTQAIAVADTFLADGVIVSTVDGGGRTLDQEVAHREGTEPEYPIAVLVNASSASASEIVAGALRNHDRAVIIGERSFGKGTVQNLYPFFDNSKLKLTISEYLTPFERSIQSVGIPADIALVPTVVDRATPEEEDPYPFALVSWRERVRREGDLDHHLAQRTMEVEAPLYSVTYWRPYDMQRRKAELNVSADYEVQFARDLLTAARGASRAAVLATAAPVVERHSKAQSARIEEKFRDLGVDWSHGAPVEAPKLAVRFDLGADGKLLAGVEEAVTLHVTNTGSTPIYQLYAVAEFGSDALGTREFPIGRLNPGETRSWQQTLELNSGNPTETVPVTFTFRDTAQTNVLTLQESLPVEGKPLPSLAWSWGWTDEAPGGDGDGIIEVGEAVRLRLKVENRGEGPTEEVVARLKNLSGKTLDILSGTLEPGAMRYPDGRPCLPEKAGYEAGKIVGDGGDKQALWASREAPTYPSACRRSLAPGESWEGDFLLEPKLATDPKRRVKLTLGDASAYDYATVMRAGFYEYFMHEEVVPVDVGWPGESSTLRVPPVITLTAGASTTAGRPLHTLSGVARDDHHLAHVMVFDQVQAETLEGEVTPVLQGNAAATTPDKVFFQGASAAGQAIPFTADVGLEPGSNTISIIATDDEGFSTTRSVVTWLKQP